MTTGLDALASRGQCGQPQAQQNGRGRLRDGGHLGIAAEDRRSALPARQEAEIALHRDSDLVGVAHREGHGRDGHIVERVGKRQARVFGVGGL